MKRSLQSRQWLPRNNDIVKATKRVAQSSFRDCDNAQDLQIDVRSKHARLFRLWPLRREGVKELKPEHNIFGVLDIMRLRFQD